MCMHACMNVLACMCADAGFYVTNLGNQDRISACVCVFVCMNVGVCAHACLCMLMNVYVNTCACEHVHACVCMGQKLQNRKKVLCASLNHPHSDSRPSNLPFRIIGKLCDASMHTNFHLSGTIFKS